jgi:hypothetical protein
MEQKVAVKVGEANEILAKTGVKAGAESRLTKVEVISMAQFQAMPGAIGAPQGGNVNIAERRYGTKTALALKTLAVLGAFTATVLSVEV